ncbi:sulfurase [Pelagibacteraceae bacterium]|nr:sulfurase [Candidatus Pelagibacter bacterium]MDC1253953.1 sulfurase [Pelagibacteraceae bacterium]
MSKIIKIGITEFNNKEIVEVNTIDLVAGKGIIGDRHFKDYNDPYNHLSIIESENIDEYNKKYNLDIPYLDFRRNIVTKGIRLNNLIEKKLMIGNVNLEVIDLCRPCRHLSEKLEKDNIIKEFLRKGGIRCEILNDGKISTADQINII